MDSDKQGKQNEWNSEYIIDGKSLPEKTTRMDIGYTPTGVKWGKTQDTGQFY